MNKFLKIFIVFAFIGNLCVASEIRLEPNPVTGELEILHKGIKSKSTGVGIDGNYDGVDDMTVSSASNVGIGTTSPSAKLDVVGNTELTGTLTASGNVGIGTSDTSAAKLTVEGTAAISGNVGIGTTDTSAAALTVAGDVSVSGTVTANGTGLSSFAEGVLINTSGADSDTHIAGDTDANMAHFDAGTGNVGIGTNTPASKFQVVGTASASNVGIGTTAPDVELEIVGTQGDFKIDATSTSSTIKLSSNSAANLNYGFPLLIKDTFQPAGSTISSGNATEIHFRDSSFLDDETYTISSGSGKGIGPNTSSTGFGTYGIDSFEGDFTLIHSDVSLRNNWTHLSIDNDGGTPGSESGDYANKSTTQVYSGTYSQFVSVTNAGEGLRLITPNFSPSQGYWWRVKAKIYGDTGSMIARIIQTDSPARVWSELYLSTGSFQSFFRDFFYPSNYISTTYFGLIATGGAASAYIDDFSIEKIIPFEGMLYIRCGEESSFVDVFTDENIIDDGSAAWLETDRAEVEETTDIVTPLVGTSSALFNITDVFTTGLIGTKAISSTDMTYDNLITFTVKSSINLDVGDLVFLLDDTANCASVTSTIDCPIMLANTIYTIAFPAGAGNASNGFFVDNNTIDIGLKINVDKNQVYSIWIDDVKRTSYGNVRLIGNSTNVASSSSDGNLCIYKEQYKVTPTIENKLGKTGELKIDGIY